jgi:hypothetical protein
MDRLAGLMGKSVSRQYGHFAVPRVYPIALRLRGTGNGLFSVTLADWLYPHSPGLDSRNPENQDPDHDDDPDLELRSDSDQKDEEDPHHPLNDHHDRSRDF